jgi:hypothetical protein
VIQNCNKHGLFVNDAKIGGQGKCPNCAEDEAKNPVKPAVIVVAGQDLAKRRDFSTYISLTVQKKVAKVKRLYQWPHTNYSIVMEDTKRFYKEDGCRELGVDLGVAGEPLVEQYIAMGVNAKGILFTLATKDEMITYVRNLLQRTKAGIPPYLELPRSGPFVEELLTQMKEQERIIGASERPHYDHPPDRHDDLLWALCIACYVAKGYLSNPHWVVRIR